MKTLNLQEYLLQTYSHNINDFYTVAAYSLITTPISSFFKKNKSLAHLMFARLQYFGNDNKKRKYSVLWDLSCSMVGTSYPRYTLKDDYINAYKFVLNEVLKIELPSDEFIEELIESDPILLDSDNGILEGITAIASAKFTTEYILSIIQRIINGY